MKEYKCSSVLTTSSLYSNSLRLPQTVRPTSFTEKIENCKFSFKLPTVDPEQINLLGEPLLAILQKRYRFVLDQLKKMIKPNDIDRNESWEFYTTRFV